MQFDFGLQCTSDCNSCSETVNATIDSCVDFATMNYSLIIRPLVVGLAYYSGFFNSVNCSTGAYFSNSVSNGICASSFNLDAIFAAYDSSNYIYGGEWAR
jgi:hypothetical protein